jgi:hypothetical protein
MTETAVAVRSWFHGRRRDVARPRTRFIRGYWERRRRRNPELAKALAYVQKYVAEARDLLDLDDELTLRGFKMPVRWATLALRRLHGSRARADTRSRSAWQLI